jgi:hypothetical protein
MGKNVKHICYLNITFKNTITVKANLTQEQATKAQRGAEV